jgi:ribosomal protein S18 acetylase RimI-like enzyme
VWRSSTGGELVTRIASGQVVGLAVEDFPRCASIWDLDRQPELAARLKVELASGNRMTLVYVHDGAFVGEGSLVFRHEDPDYAIAGRRAYLSRLIVKCEFRNRGIGGAIVDALIDRAERMGYDEIAVGVDVDNHAARRLYEKKGFTIELCRARDAQGEYVKLLRVRRDVQGSDTR